METETEQATVLYTADATSAPSTEYASSDQPKFNLLVAEQQTFRAIARREGFKDSEEATIDHKPATVPDPEIERVGPDVNQAVITCTDKTATIHYKFDESETKQEHSVDTHVDSPCENPQPVVVWAQATKPGFLVAGKSTSPDQNFFHRGFLVTFALEEFDHLPVSDSLRSGVT